MHLRWLFSDFLKLIFSSRDDKVNVTRILELDIYKREINQKLATIERLSRWSLVSFFIFSFCENPVVHCDIIDEGDIIPHAAITWFRLQSLLNHKKYKSVFIIWIQMMSLLAYLGTTLLFTYLNQDWLNNHWWLKCNLHVCIKLKISYFWEFWTRNGGLPWRIFPGQYNRDHLNSWIPHTAWLQL